MKEEPTQALSKKPKESCKFYFNFLGSKKINGMPTVVSIGGFLVLFRAFSYSRVYFYYFTQLYLFMNRKSVLKVKVIGKTSWYYIKQQYLAHNSEHLCFVSYTVGICKTTIWHYLLLDWLKLFRLNVDLQIWNWMF